MKEHGEGDPTHIFSIRCPMMSQWCNKLCKTHECILKSYFFYIEAKDLSQLCYNHMSKNHKIQHFSM